MSVNTAPTQQPPDRDVKPEEKKGEVYTYQEKNKPNSYRAILQGNLSPYLQGHLLSITSDKEAQAGHLSLAAPSSRQ